MVNRYTAAYVNVLFCLCHSTGNDFCKFSLSLTLFMFRSCSDYKVTSFCQPNMTVPFGGGERYCCLSPGDNFSSWLCHTRYVSLYSRSGKVSTPNQHKAVSVDHMLSVLFSLRRHRITFRLRWCDLSRRVILCRQYGPQILLWVGWEQGLDCRKGEELS